MTSEQTAMQLTSAWKGWCPLRSNSRKPQQFRWPCGKCRTMCPKKNVSAFNLNNPFLGARCSRWSLICWGDTILCAKTLNVFERWSFSCISIREVWNTICMFFFNEVRADSNAQYRSCNHDCSPGVVWVTGYFSSITTNLMIYASRCELGIYYWGATSTKNLLANTHTEREGASCKAESFCTLIGFLTQRIIIRTLSRSCGWMQLTTDARSKCPIS